MDDSWRVPFARFLVKRGAVAESKVRYHVLWVERLLAFAPAGHDPVGSEIVSAFLAALGRSREPRQVQQAQEAARLYRFFRREGVSPSHPAPADWDALLGEAVRILRLQRLSVRTERSYLAWWRRFRDYLHEQPPVALDVSHVEAFLSHLAVDEGVAASTQNQALSGLLFLYRHALGMEVGDLSHMVRARERRRVPMVLSREEVRNVLARLAYPYGLMCRMIYGCGLRLQEC